MDCEKDCELKEYVIDLEEENENLSEENRLLVEKIKDLEKCINSK